MRLVGRRRRAERTKALGTLVIYAALAVIALGLGLARGESPFVTTPRLPLGGPALVATSIGLGVALAAVTVAATRAFVRHFTWARGLHEELRPAVRDVSTRLLFLMAVLSGIGEELFFRGLLAPLLGALLSSVLFGLLHQAPGRARFVWVAWATVMGLAFSGIFLITGSLAGAILAHVAINAVNLVYLRDTSAAPKAPRKLGGLLRSS